AKYIEIPIQHISSTVLKRMNRRGNKEFIEDLLNKIRGEIPQAIIRTTYIVGFPGETHEDFNQLYEFTEKFQFDRLGVFAYSKEEDTGAYSMINQVDELVKEERLEKIMKLQKRLSRQVNKKQLGSIHNTLIENYDPETKFYYGRSFAFAPDDIDGMIVFQSNKPLEIGQMVNVKIKTFFGYDLIGDRVEGEDNVS
ncbi:MAG: radical SAM protein, partial [Candidatus Izemoplasmatales bacterium]